MKEKIIEIVGFNMEPERAELIAQQVLDLFGVSHRNLNQLKIEWLINDTYQVIDESENVLHQGSISDCNDYLTSYYGG